MKFIRLFDPALRKLFARESQLQKEHDFHAFRIDAMSKANKSKVESVLIDMANIDTKSTALLTHISVIIAALVFSLGEVSEGWLRFAIGVELFCYVVVAFFNLRCLNIMGPPHMFFFDDAETYENSIATECLLRRSIYVYCLRTMVALTAVLPFLILVKGFQEVFN
ncbi:MAG: hypothetical protein AAFY80_12000 [Pseudomonadota bacterium]